MSEPTMVTIRIPWADADLLRSTLSFVDSMSIPPAESAAFGRTMQALGEALKQQDETLGLERPQEGER